MNPVIWGAVAFVAINLSSVASAQNVADFYKDKTINIYVGYPPGGAYDVYSRIIANHMSQYIPGNPSFIVRNRPGAGSMILVNELYSLYPKDGTVIGTFVRSAALDRLLGRSGANFNPTELNWIGSVNNEVSTCAVWHSAQVHSLSDFMSKKIVLGANAPGSEMAVYPTILNNVFGAHLKIVTGYPATSDFILAIERGEIQGRCGWTWNAVSTSVPDWIKEKKLKIVVQFSKYKHPELPDVPLVMELAKTDSQRKVLQLILSAQELGRPYAAPPAVPADRVQALRRAFDATMKSPGFLKEAESRKLEVQATSGEELQNAVNEMFKSPPEIVRMVEKAITAPMK